MRRRQRRRRTLRCMSGRWRTWMRPAATACRASPACRTRSDTFQVRWACCRCPLAGMCASERPLEGHGCLVTLQLSCVICTDLQEQQGELRERRNSTEATAAAEMRRIRQTDPKLR